MGSIRVDDSQHPLVRVIVDGVVTDEQFRTYLHEVEAAGHARKRTWALLFDARRAGKTTSVQRNMQVEYMKRTRADSARYCAGISFVLATPMHRGVLSAILWLVPLPMPHRVVGDPEEGASWLAHKLAEHALRNAADSVRPDAHVGL